MIPDKIYLPKEEIEERKPWIETTYDPNWDECYIRKDALIEWANKMLQDTADRLDFHGNQAFAELYSKLNSM